MQNRDQIINELVNRLNKIRNGLNSLIFIAQSVNDDLNIIAQIIQSMAQENRNLREMNEELQKELKELKKKGKEGAKK